MIGAGVTTSPIASRSDERPLAKVFRRIGGQNISLLLALLALIAIFGSLHSSIFFLPRNIANIANAVTILAIVAMAETIVIVSGGIDVSVGSMTGLASVAAATALAETDQAIVGVGTALLVGTAAGIVNGLLVTKGRVNPIIATLGTLSAFKGLAFIVTNGPSVAISNAAYDQLGAGRVWGVPVPVLIALATAVAFHLLMRNTDIGRNIYALGGSARAAHLAGVKVDKYRIGIYALSGFACGVAAIVLSARATTAMPASGSEGLELEAITAAFLGGCAMSGGKGTIFGTILGVLIIGTLNNGMILAQVPTFYQLLAKGALLIGAVMIMELRQTSGKKY
jgi:ribose/xylose/arabinose/galactoside ABC-type transport system permease subunit